MSPRHTILIVDDEAEVVRSVKDLMRLEYRVIGATSAADAMSILDHQEIHVVMTDQRMPGMTGVDLLHRVRSEHPDAVRLLFTGYADIRAVIDAINQGNVYRYINKPWDPDELLAIIRDSCERYALIAQRRQLLKELAQKNEELESANRALAQTSELKTAFIRVASHELRAPLTVLTALTWLIRRTPDLPGSLEERVRSLDTATRRLNRVVEEITTMLRAGLYAWPLQRQPMDVNALFQQAAEDVKPFAQLRFQRIQIEVPAGTQAVEVDGAKLRDCLNHLLMNAIKFSLDGTAITLSAARTEDGWGALQVRDRGVGMDAATRARLFEPFFTGFDTAHHSSGLFEFGARGLGLGLSVVKALIEMHGGRIEVESEPGKGSTFTLLLPPPPAAAAAATP